MKLENKIEDEKNRYDGLSTNDAFEHLKSKAVKVNRKKDSNFQINGEYYYVSDAEAAVAARKFIYQIIMPDFKKTNPQHYDKMMQETRKKGEIDVNIPELIFSLLFRKS